MLDFRRLCNDKRIPLLESGHHHAHSGWLQTHCPFCAGGRSGWHLGFSLDHGNLNCWRCGSHSAWEFIKEALRVSGPEAGRLLQEYDDHRTRLPEAIQPRKQALSPPLNCTTMGPQHQNYLINRGFDPVQLEEEWGLQGTFHLSGEWNWRIIIPILESDGRTVAYTGRAIHPDLTPRYKTSDKADWLVDPREVLYGLHRAGDSVVIVEGPADVWRLGPGAVATLGIDWKVEQAARLRTFQRRFVMFDPEPEAQRRAQQLAEWLGTFSGDTEVIDGLDTDPGDMPQRDADALMRELGLRASLVPSR